MSPWPSGPGEGKLISFPPPRRFHHQDHPPMIAGRRLHLQATKALLSSVPVGAVLALVAAVPPAFAQGQASAEGLEFFEKKVRPLLVERCYECHSAQGKKSKGGLRVDTRDALLKGGDSGPALVPGDP